MPALTQSNPKYRKHKASGQAMVELSGKLYYLGPYGTKASRFEYDRLIALWLAAGRQLPTAGSDITIVEMLARFRRHAVKHYRKNGRPTRTLGNLDDAMRPLNLLFGHDLVQDFGPLKLQAVRSLMVQGFADARGKIFGGLSRRTVNQRIGMLKLILR